MPERTEGRRGQPESPNREDEACRRGARAPELPSDGGDQTVPRPTRRRATSTAAGAPAAMRHGSVSDTRQLLPLETGVLLPEGMREVGVDTRQPEPAVVDVASHEPATSGMVAHREIDPDGLRGHEPRDDEDEQPEYEEEGQSPILAGVRRSQGLGSCAGRRSTRDNTDRRELSRLSIR